MDDVDRVQRETDIARLREMAVMLAYNMMTPPVIRGLLGGRTVAYEEVMRKIAVPVLVTQGREDVVILPAMSENTLALIKHAKGLFYDGVGHSPFYEAADRFNAELAAFVRSLPGDK